MRLQYLKDKAITVKWLGTSEYTNFEPFGIAETTEERGKRLLANVEYKGWFKEVIDTPMELFPCPSCNMTFKTKAALGSHKRKHKETVT